MLLATPAKSSKFIEFELLTHGLVWAAGLYMSSGMVGLGMIVPHRRLGFAQEIRYEWRANGEGLQI